MWPDFENTRHKNWWALAIIFGCAFLFLSDLFLGNKIFLTRDALTAAMPMREFAAQSIKDGVIPFWNPYFGAGKPFVGDMEGFFYPFNWFVFFFSPALAMKVHWWFHFGVAGFGAFLLCRQFLFGWTASLTAAISYMLGSWYVIRMEFLSDFSASAWCPWTLALLVCFYRESAESPLSPLKEIWRQRALLAALAAVFALQFSANYPEILIYPMVGVACFIGLSILLSRKIRFVMLGVFWALAGLLAVGLVTGQLALLMEFLPFSERKANFDTRFWMASISPAHLLTAIFPFVGGRPGYPNLNWDTGVYEYWAGAFYLGVMMIVAAPFSILWLWTKWQRKGGLQRLGVLWALSMIVIGLVLSAGSNLPVYEWAYRHLPGMNWLRFPSKFLVLVVLGLTLLGAAGIDALWKQVSSGALVPRASRIFFAMLALGAAAVVFGIWAALDPYPIRALFGIPPSIPDKTILGSGLFLDVFFILGSLGLLGVLIFSRHPVVRRALPLVFPAFVLLNMKVESRQLFPTASDWIANERASIAGEALNLSPEFRIHSPYAPFQQYLYGTSDGSIYQWARTAGVGAMWLSAKAMQIGQTGFKLDGYNQMLGLMEGARSSFLANNIADALSIRWAVVGGRWEEIYFARGDRRLRVVERPSALPRMRLIADWGAVSSGEEVLKKFLEMGVDPNFAAVEPTALEGGKVVKEPVPQGDFTFRKGTILNSEYQLNSLAARVETPNPNLLLISDSWFPGWKATVDGKETPIFRTNYLFRGVFVPSGRHEVRLSYFPNRFIPASLVSLLFLLIVGFLFLRPGKYSVTRVFFVQ